MVTVLLESGQVLDYRKHEIFDANRIRIASHQRSFAKRYVTDTAHMPEKHRRYLEAKQFDGHRYRSWAKNIGPETYQC